MNIVKLPAACVLLLILTTYSSFGQTGSFLSDYLQRWENSKKYMIAVAESMPDSGYGFKPTDGEMSFAEQLVHICAGIDWHAQMLIGGRKEEGMPKEVRQKKFSAEGKTKKEIIELIGKTFDDATTVIKKYDPPHLEDSITYLNKTRTKMQVFLLLSDHVTHHRAQTLVYLRLKGIVPPEYANYQ